MQSFLRPTRVVAVASVAGLAAANQYVANEEGAQRSLTFWKEIFPIYLHYRYYQLLNRDLKILSDAEAKVEFDRLHEKYTHRVRDLVYNMRGFYLKQAQLLSTQDDFIPPAYMAWVKDTQDRVPSEFEGSEARRYVAKQLRAELDLDFDDVFESFDDVPLGVASIGQVHRAVLKNTKQVVAVKILVPDIEKKFRSDIRTIKSFCELAMPQHVTSFDETEKQFCTEFDYTLEGHNLSLMYQAIMPKWGHAVRIPKPYPHLCSKHILVMEFLDGVKLVDGIRKQFKRIAELSGRTLEDIERERREQIQNGTFKFKSIEESKAEKAYIDRMLMIKDITNLNNIARFFYNYSPLAWWYGPASYEHTERSVDLGNLVELLARVHANQLFEHGAFNGDPHPGNIMLLNDGRLGLIDYGQVKKMTLKERITYAKLILAHSRGDVEEIVRIHFHELGTKTKNLDKEIGYLMSCFYNDRDTEDVCKGMNIAEFIDWLEAKDPMIRVPEEYIFASRVNLMIRGMGKAFGIKLRMSKLWEHEAKAFLESQGIQY